MAGLIVEGDLSICRRDRERSTCMLLPSTPIWIFSTIHFRFDLEADMAATCIAT